MNYQILTNDTAVAVKDINALRLENKDQWVFAEILHRGKIVLLKSYNTSIQILRVDGVNHGGQWDISVKDFKAAITAALSSY
jgi:hypothetical protein